VRTSIVHLIRNSLDDAGWDKRRLRPMYQALNADAAEQALLAFESGFWGKQYPTVVAPGSALGIGLSRSACFQRH